MLGSFVAASNIDSRRPSEVPPAIPASQRYYWSMAWQRDEREALRELENGDFVEFDNTLDLFRWLLSPDD